MSPERTSNVTSLPVRAERASRSDRAPASDVFATLLDAHADRADRAPSRRERQPANDDAGRERTRDARPLDHPTDPRGRREPTPASERPASAEPTEPTATPVDDAAAAASALLGLMATVTPRQPAPTPVPVEAAPVVDAQAPQPAPAPQTLAVEPQPAADVAEPSHAVVPPQAAPSDTAGEGAKARHADTVGIEDKAPDAPEATKPVTAETPVAGRAPVADSGNSRTVRDRKSEAVSGVAAEARPSAQAPVNDAPTSPTTSGEQNSASQQGGQEQQDAPAPRTMQPTAAASAPAQRIDVTPVNVTGPGQVPTTPEPKGAATLAQAPRAVGQLIHLASERGVQHARLNLKPAELGGIEIRLIASSAGVAAHVVADSPEAARLLQQAGEDLKRSLAAQNVELLSLDVSTSGDDRRDATAANGGFEQFDETGPRGRDGLGRPQRAGETDIDLPISPAQGTVIELPEGVLVDVLA